MVEHAGPRLVAIGVDSPLDSLALPLVVLPAPADVLDADVVAGRIEDVVVALQSARAPQPDQAGR